MPGVSWGSALLAGPGRPACSCWSPDKPRSEAHEGPSGVRASPVCPRHTVIPTPELLLLAARPMQCLGQTVVRAQKGTWWFLRKKTAWSVCVRGQATRGLCLGGGVFGGLSAQVVGNDYTVTCSLGMNPKLSPSAGSWARRCCPKEARGALLGKPVGICVCVNTKMHMTNRT